MLLEPGFLEQDAKEKSNYPFKKIAIFNSPPFG